MLGGHGIRISSWLGHLPGTSGGPRTPKGTGGTPRDQVGRGTWGEWRGRRSGGGTGLVPLRGGWRKGRDPTPKGGNWGTVGRAEDQKGAWPSFPCPLGPPGTCWDPGPDPQPTETPSSHACPEGVGGREGGAKVKTRPLGLTPLRGGWGRGGVPTPSGMHPQLGVQRRWGRPWGRQWGSGVKEWKGTWPVLSLST